MINMSGEVAGSPKYRLIADDLRSAIRCGHFAPGDRLPGENLLMERYGVARMTARQALSVLQSEGLTMARKGSGVFVRDFRPVVRNGIARLSKEQWSTGRGPWDAQVDGRPLTVDSLVVTLETAHGQMADLLDVTDGEPAVVRRRRYLLDARPVLVATSWLPAAIAVGTRIAEPDTGPGGVYARLADLGRPPARFREDVRARMPSPEEQTALHLEQGMPVVQVLRTAIDAAGHPLEVNDMVLDAGVHVLRYDFEA